MINKHKLTTLTNEVDYEIDPLLCL